MGIICTMSYWNHFSSLQRGLSLELRTVAPPFPGTALTPWGRPATGSLGSAAPRRYPARPPRLAPTQSTGPSSPCQRPRPPPAQRSRAPTDPPTDTLLRQPRVPARLPPGAGRPRSLARTRECCSGTRSRTGAPDRPATQSTGAEPGRGGRGRTPRGARSGPSGRPRWANPGGRTRRSGAPPAAPALAR